MRKLESQLEYEVTCEKLSELEQMRKQSQERQSENPYVKELTLRSLGRLIKQLQEEKIWYECHAGLRKPSGPAVARCRTPEKRLHRVRTKSHRERCQRGGRLGRRFLAESRIARHAAGGTGGACRHGRRAGRRPIDPATRGARRHDVSRPRQSRRTQQRWPPPTTPIW